MRMVSTLLVKWLAEWLNWRRMGDRKSTRLNSSHGYISYAVFCLKKKKNLDQFSGHVLMLTESSLRFTDQRLVHQPALRRLGESEFNQLRDLFSRYPARKHVARTE